MKKILHILLCITLTAGFISTSEIASADTTCKTVKECDQQIQATKDAASANQKSINNIQDMINSLNAQAAATQTEINLTNQKIALTNSQIAATQNSINENTAQLKKQKQNLYDTMVAYYENENNQSTLETLVSSNSLSDAIDKAQYLESISGSLNDSINSINKTMADLQTEQNNLNSQKSSLTAQQNSLIDGQRNLNIQSSQKNSLLAAANAKQTQLQATLEEQNRDRNAAAASAAYHGGDTKNIGSGGTGGYPFGNSTPDQADPWGFYTRECTSYAAWYFNNIEGKAFYNTRPGSGSAWNWPALAADQGYTVSATPQVGAIVSWSNATIPSYGHVAIVQKVYSDGSFDVSQYNWIQYAYSEMHVTGNLAAAGRFIY